MNPHRHFPSAEPKHDRSFPKFQLLVKDLKDLMEQRPPRLGDIVDDYCPRERRITNHAVVAMIEEKVKQTRCTTCEAEHKYKAGKAPPKRRPKAVTALAAEGRSTQALRARPPAELETEDAAAPDVAADGVDPLPATGHSDEETVRRPLIRATLPRVEGQTSERRPPEFTIRQSAGRNGSSRSGSTRGYPATRQSGNGGRPLDAFAARRSVAGQRPNGHNGAGARHRKPRIAEGGHGQPNSSRPARSSRRRRNRTK